VLKQKLLLLILTSLEACFYFDVAGRYAELLNLLHLAGRYAELLKLLHLAGRYAELRGQSRLNNHVQPAQSSY
jgi:hypothetical protein